LCRDAGLQSSECPEIDVPVCGIAGTHAVGHPDVVVAEQKSRRHDRDQGSRLAIQHECLPNQAGIAVELLLPQAMAHGEYRCSARVAIGANDHAAQ